MFEAAHVGLQKQKEDLSAKVASLTETNTKVCNDLALAQQRLISLQVCFDFSS
jgi:hypothetical protein